MSSRYGELWRGGGKLGGMTPLRKAMSNGLSNGWARPLQARQGGQGGPHNRLDEIRYRHLSYGRDMARGTARDARDASDDGWQKQESLPDRFPDRFPEWFPLEEPRNWRAEAEAQVRDSGEIAADIVSRRG